METYKVVKTILFLIGVPMIYVGMVNWDVWYFLIIGLIFLYLSALINENDFA